MYKLFYIALFCMIIIFSCSKNSPKACFTIDKDTVAIGDTVTFTDCSDYGDNPPAGRFRFGDGYFLDVYTKGIVKHAYSSIGVYEVTLSIGGPEKVSRYSDTIIVQ